MGVFPADESGKILNYTALFSANREIKSDYLMMAKWAVNYLSSEITMLKVNCYL